MSDYISCTVPQDTPIISQFEFRDNESWILRITKNGIVFNHEEWPDSTPSDFAQAFCDVLEKGYDITFTKRISKCDEEPDLSHYGMGKRVWKTKKEMLDQFPE